MANEPERLEYASRQTPKHTPEQRTFGLDTDPVANGKSLFVLLLIGAFAVLLMLIAAMNIR